MARCSPLNCWSSASKLRFNDSAPYGDSTPSGTHACLIPWNPLISSGVKGALDGVRCLWLPAPDAGQVLIVFAISALEPKSCVEVLQFFRDQFKVNVLAPVCEGSPLGVDEQRARADLTVFRFLVDVVGVRYDQLVLFGDGVGSLPAVQLAATYPVGGLWLVSPSASYENDCSPDVRHKLIYSNICSIGNVTCPCLIFQGCFCCGGDGPVRLFERCRSHKLLGPNVSFGSQRFASAAINFFGFPAICTQTPPRLPESVFLLSANMSVSALTVSQLFDRDAKDEEGLTVLIRAVDGEKSDAVAQLLHDHADPNIADPQGATALHYAALLGSEAIVQLLLAAGADPCLLDEDGATPATTARMYGHVSLVDLLAPVEGRLRISAGEQLSRDPSSILLVEPTANQGALVDKVITGMASTSSNMTIDALASDSEAIRNDSSIACDVEECMESFNGPSVQRGFERSNWSKEPLGKCQICMEAHRTHALVPCGHLLCAECSIVAKPAPRKRNHKKKRASKQNCAQCPFCRQDVQTVVKLYL